MLKKIIIITVIILVLVAILEGVALIHEKQSVAKFANYWKAQNKTATGNFTYVALGDSTAQGIGASKPENSYAGLVAKRVAQQTGQTVRLVNLSKTGARINDVLTVQLAELAKYKPDLVTIEIGANDLSGYDAAKFKDQFNQLAKRLPAGTYVSNMPYFGGRIRANPKALDANISITKALAPQHLILVDLQTLTHDRQSYRNYAVDLFHPSSRGYVNWADAFWQKIQPNLK